MAKRRATRDVDDSEEDVDAHSSRRRLNAHESDSSSERDDSSPQPTSLASPLQPMITKLVRLALSAEYARIPIRRSDIGVKVLGENGARQFKAVFDGAQKELQGKFGMQLMELPGREREKLGMTQRRAQASQKSQSASSKSWTLISILPTKYKDSPIIARPQRAPSSQAESTYIALYTFLITLVLLSPSQSLPEAKVERYLKRANADTWTTLGQTDKVLQRMIKEGYLVKFRDTTSGEEIIEYSIGPRGKVEVGRDGAMGLVRKVYQGTDMTEEELNKKIQRSLADIDQPHENGTTASRTDGNESQVATGGRKTRRRNQNDDD